MADGRRLLAALVTVHHTGRCVASGARKLGSSPKNRPIRGKQLAVLKLLQTNLNQEEIAKRAKCSRSFVSLVWQRHKLDDKS